MVKKQHIANILLLITLICFIINIGDFKYLVAFIAIGVLGFLFLSNDGLLKKMVFESEFKGLVFICLIFSLETIILQLFHGYNSYFFNEVLYYPPVSKFLK